MHTFLIAEAVAVWQWLRWLHGQLPSHSTPVLLNLDETCIKFFYTPRVGMRVRCKKRRPEGCQSRQKRHTGTVAQGDDPCGCYMQRYGPPAIPDSFACEEVCVAQAASRVASHERMQCRAGEAACRKKGREGEI